MVASLLVLVALAAGQARDTATYADSSTAHLVAKARQRHSFQDTLVHDYEALVRTRIDAGAARSRFSFVHPIVATETAARVTWALPNDLVIRLLGTRQASIFPGLNIDQSFGRPWFVPRGLGDSIRFADAGIPETAGLHPLAPGSEAFYRYAIVDSVTITLPDHAVHVIGIRFEPKRMGPSLIAGNLWVDGETAEVVRMTFVFIGEYLWQRPDNTTARDSAQARKESARAMRILKVEAELEYALHETRYWMPYRQLVTLTVDVPVIVTAHVPVRFLTTFSDYAINTGVRPHFAAADSIPRYHICRRAQDSACVHWRQGHEQRIAEGYARSRPWRNGRWEMETPPRDSLLSYQWPDQLALQPDPAAEQLIRETATTLAKVSQHLPPAWMGRKEFGFAVDRLSDLMRYNRVEGLSFGAGYQWRVGTGFNSLLGAARYGLSDRRVTASLTWRHDAPAGRLDLGAWRTPREVEPWTSGLGMSNSVNAVLGAHDDADYFLSLGGGVSYSGNVGLLRDMDLGLRLERTSSMSLAASSALNDFLGGNGLFQANPPVVPGDFITASIARHSGVGPLDLRYGVDGDAGIGHGASGLAGTRGWVSTRLRFGVGKLGAALNARISGSAGDSLPQLMFRAGGPLTVRGYGYGTRMGRSGWSGQFEIEPYRRSAVTGVLFVDAGNAFGAGQPLVGAGAGLSFFGGLMRLDFAKGLNPAASVRCDLVFRASR